MVAHTLHVADCVEQGGYHFIILIAQMQHTQINQILGNIITKLINDKLSLLYICHLFLIVVRKRRECQRKVLSRNTPHADGFQLCALYRNRRSGHHTLVQMHQLCLVALCFHRLEAVYLHGKFDNIAAEGHQDNRCTHVENRMDKGNLRHIDNALAIGRVQSRKQKHCKDTENNRTRNIEGQMHRTNAFCIFACADRA